MIQADLNIPTVEQDKAAAPEHWPVWSEERWEVLIEILLHITASDINTGAQCRDHN